MSDSDSDFEYKYDLHKYSLVRFVHKGRKRKLESVDIVPSKWLDFDKTKGRCVTKFLDDPYTDEDIQLLHELVKNNVDAPEDWPSFTIEQVGRAKTYSEGLRKLKQLRTEDNVLTANSEDSTSEVQAQLTSAVKRRKLQAEAMKLMANVFSTPSLNGAQVESSGTSSSNVKGQQDQESKNVHEKKSQVKECEEKTTLQHKSTKDQHLNLVHSEPLPSTSSSFIDFHDDYIMSAPIINMESVDCKTSFEAAVLVRLDNMNTTLNELKVEVASLKNAQAETSNFLSDKKLMEKTSVDLETKYGVSVPIPTYEAFLVFEEMLSNNSYFKKDVYIELKSMVDKEFNIPKSMVKMLKKFMTKDLAQQFTAIRTSAVNKNKFKFKPTQLCSLIEAVIIKSRNSKSLCVDQEALNSSLTDVLTNVSKWKI